MAHDNFSHISLSREITWPSGKWGKELYLSHREALQITWQEAGIYNLLGKEEAKVGNKDTEFHNKYLDHKYLLPSLLHTKYTTPQQKSPKSLMGYDSKWKAQVLIIVSTLKVVKCGSSWSRDPWTKTKQKTVIFSSPKFNMHWWNRTRITAMNSPICKGE